MQSCSPRPATVWMPACSGSCSRRHVSRVVALPRPCQHMKVGTCAGLDFKPDPVDPAGCWYWRSGSGGCAAPRRRACETSRQCAPKLRQIAQKVVRHPANLALLQNRRTGSASHKKTLSSPAPAAAPAHAPAFQRVAVLRCPLPDLKVPAPSRACRR